MGMLIGLIALLVFIGVLVLLASLMADERRLRVQERVQQLQKRPRSPLAEELALPFHERILLPVLNRLLNSVGALAPREALENARVELERAGRPGGLTAQSFITLRIFSIAAGLSTAVWIFKAGLLSDSLRLPAAVLALIVGVLAPQYFLQKSIQARHNQIRKALPDIIDLLVVSVEAGAGLDGALAEVVSRKQGPLPDEFNRLLGEVRVGKTRKQAWQDMSSRVAEENLTALVASLAQAEQLGVSIAKALRTQADSLRTRRSLQIREVAAALPVKMLFPLIFFIFPALFVVLLGPGLLSMTSVLGALGGK
jgi:tight adherence protein C